MSITFPKFSFTVSTSYHFRPPEWCAKHGYTKAGDQFTSPFDIYVPIHSKDTFEGAEPVNYVRDVIANSFHLEDADPPEFVYVYAVKGVLKAHVCNGTPVDNSGIVVQSDNNLALQAILDGRPHKGRLTRAVITQLFLDNEAVATLVNVTDNKWYRIFIERGQTDFRVRVRYGWLPNGLKAERLHTEQDVPLDWAKTMFNAAIGAKIVHGYELITSKTAG